MDFVHQHIANYHPNVRCRRHWLTMFIQLMSIIRTNLYIVHKKYFGRESLSHKKFTWEMISYLMKMTTVKSTSKSIPSNAVSYGESKQTENSDLTSPSAGKKRTIASSPSILFRLPKNGQTDKLQVLVL